MPIDPKVPYSDVTYAIIGAAMRVHSRLGPGLKEVHYQLLPPKVLDGWQLKIGRLLWRPESAEPVPAIISPENVHVVRADRPRAPGLSSTLAEPGPFQT